jgi:hypothetical protein
LGLTPRSIAHPILLIVLPSLLVPIPQLIQTLRHPLPKKVVPTLLLKFPSRNRGLREITPIISTGVIGFKWDRRFNYWEIRLKRNSYWRILLIPPKPSHPP